MGIGAMLAACVAGYALWTLTQAPKTPAEQAAEQAEQTTGLEQKGVDGHAGSAGEIAQTETMEEILGAVQVYVQNEQFPQATTVLENAVTQYGGDQELRFALGDLYMLQKRHSDAYAQYIAGIEIGPSSSGAEFTAGTLANMLDRSELAELHYMKSMQMDPKNPDTPVFLAAIQLKMNRLDEAKVNLALAGRLAPDRARIFAMRSEIGMRENKLNIALEQIQKARAIEPNAMPWILQEARVHKRNAEPEKAINLLTAIPDGGTIDPEVAYVLADCFGMIGKPDEAASRLMDLAAIRDQDPKLAFQVALWLERAGERDAAIEWGNKAHSLGNPQASGWIESLPATASADEP